MRFRGELVGKLDDATLEKFFQSLVAAINGHGVPGTVVKKFGIFEAFFGLFQPGFSFFFHGLSITRLSRSRCRALP